MTEDKEPYGRIRVSAMVTVDRSMAILVIAGVFGLGISADEIYARLTKSPVADIRADSSPPDPPRNEGGRRWGERHRVDPLQDKRNWDDLFEDINRRILNNQNKQARVETRLQILGARVESHSDSLKDIREKLKD